MYNHILCCIIPITEVRKMEKNIRKFWMYTMLVISAAFIFVGINQSASIEAQAQEGEQEETYVIGTDTTYAPFEFVDDNGDFVGIDIDILDAIAEDQGFNYEINVLGFNAAVQALESQQVDGVIAGMGITEERQESFDFSDPYFDTTTMFGVPTDSDVETMEDLEGETVAVKTGTTGAEAAQELQDEYGFEIVQFEDSVTMYEDVNAGNAAAAVEDAPVMQYAMNTGAIDFRFIGEPIDSIPLGLAVPKGENQELVEMFNEGLQNIQESGEYDQIIERYLGEEAIQEQQQSGGFFSLLANNISPLLSGLWTTIWLTLISIIIAMIAGVIIGLMRTSDNKLLSGLGLLYIDIMRGIPLIVLSFFIYFGVPQLLGINMGAIQAGIATLSLNATAYIAEIVRGGINAVDPGQSEAGRSLGLSKRTTMRHIVLPQAIKIMVPSLINQFVITLKDSSILSVIGIAELTQTGRIIIARTYQSGAMWLIVGIMYIIVITILTKLSNYIERKWITND